MPSSFDTPLCTYIQDTSETCRVVYSYSVCNCIDSTGIVPIVSGVVVTVVVLIISAVVIVFIIVICIRRGELLLLLCY